MRWIALLSLALACGSTTAAPPRVAAPAAPVVRSLPLEGDVTTARMTYSFRASPLVNLFYELDCLSGMIRCSREAFERTWKTTLGLDDADRAALDGWRSLHRSYDGDIHRSDEAADAALPLWGRRIGMEGRMRLAGYGARDVDDALSRLALLIEPGDVARARELLARFQPRFERYWATRRDDLARQVAGFVRVMQREDVRALVDSIATFYEPDLGASAHLVVELVARPEHDSPDHGEQLSNVSLVEVLPGHTAESRLDVILHEAFHFWFGAATTANKRALVQRFVDSPSPLAIPAYGLLDEVLAAALGNGLVGRLVARADFDKRMKRPEGLYMDPYIDPVAKAMMPVLEARLAAKKSVFADDFVAEYVGVVERTLVRVGPAAFVRPLVSVYDPALKDAEFHLYDVVRSGHTESDDDLGDAGEKLLRKHAKWGTVLAVTPKTLARLARFRDWVDGSAVAALRREASHTPFVLTIPRKKAAPVFVFVSKDDAEMRALDDAFAALDQVHVGVWRP